MDEAQVREHAEALCSALVAGDIDRVTADFSDGLRHNLGEVLAIFMLPSEAATIEAVERAGGSGFTVLMRLDGAGEQVVVETRWKDRDGRPTIIEASHLSRTATPDAADDGEAALASEGSEPTA